MLQLYPFSSTGGRPRAQDRSLLFKKRRKERVSSGFDSGYISSGFDKEHNSCGFLLLVHTEKLLPAPTDTKFSQRLRLPIVFREVVGSSNYGLSEMNTKANKMEQEGQMCLQTQLALRPALVRRP